MKPFSERHGYTKAKDKIQKGFMDDDLRIGLWNLIYKSFFIDIDKSFPFSSDAIDHYIYSIWTDFFIKPLDEMELNITDKIATEAVKQIHDLFFELQWSYVYNFLEFTVTNYPKNNFMPILKFKKNYNLTLNDKLSAYRFVGNLIAEITSQEEIQEIDKAFTSSPSNVRKHIQCALKLFSDNLSSRKHLTRFPT